MCSQFVMWQRNALLSTIPNLGDDKTQKLSKMTFKNGSNAMQWIACCFGGGWGGVSYWRSHQVDIAGKEAVPPRDGLASRWDVQYWGRLEPQYAPKWRKIRFGGPKNAPKSPKMPFGGPINAPRFLRHFRNSLGHNAWAELLSPVHPWSLTVRKRVLFTCVWADTEQLACRLNSWREINMFTVEVLPMACFTSIYPHFQLAMAWRRLNNQTANRCLGR